MAGERDVLQRLRRLCLALPEACETTSFGHPTFKAGRRTFCVLERYGGHLTVALPVGHAAQRALLTDRRFQPTPYVGQHGWVSLIVDARVDGELLAGLVRQAYEHVALKRMRAALARPAKDRPVKVKVRAKAKPKGAPDETKAERRAAPGRGRR